MQPILEIQHITKQFRLQHRHEPYLSLRDSLRHIFTPSNTSEEFKALDDVSFQVQAGEAVGIIGRNGAGKSTLLKILSKISPPSNGRIICRGRIASMLEVGTGFHSELSGRENIFFNGSILGMKRREIVGKFDEIVAFSGVEKFLDTPIKHYSSGMQLRLAFAVAAFLEPEILVIDEVLSVGDAEFQKKCLGKMEDVSKSGRTILFVSHNLSLLSSLCSRGVLLDKGVLKMSGPIDTVVPEYFKLAGSSVYQKTWTLEEAPSSEKAALLGVQFLDQNKGRIHSVSLQSSFGVEMKYYLREDGLEFSPNIHVYNNYGECAFVAIAPRHTIVRKKGEHSITLWIPGNQLNAGIYHFGFALTSLNNMHVHFYEKNSISIEVVENTSLRDNDFVGVVPGVVRPMLEWN